MLSAGTGTECQANLHAAVFRLKLPQQKLVFVNNGNQRALNLKPAEGFIFLCFSLAAGAEARTHSRCNKRQALRRRRVSGLLMKRPPMTRRPTPPRKKRLNMTAIIVPIVLNRISYDNRSSRIKSYLLAEDLWDVVEGADNREDEPWRKKNVKALNAIKNSCGNETYKIIKDTDSAKEAWEMLKTLKRKYNQSSSKLYRIDTRTILQAYSTDLDEAYWIPTDLDDWPELAMEEGRTGGLVDESNENNENKTRFVNYVKSKHWYVAIEFLRHHPQVGSARISSDGTALHQAVQPFSKCSRHFMEELVGLMEKEDFAIQDGLGRTALLLLIREYPEMVEIAELMVARNKNLLTILPSGSQVPLVVEAERQEKENGSLSLFPHQMRNTKGRVY